jgi:hypothetical protein
MGGNWRSKDLAAVARGCNRVLGLRRPMSLLAWGPLLLPAVCTLQVVVDIISGFFG